MKTTRIWTTLPLFILTLTTAHAEGLTITTSGIKVVHQEVGEGFNALRPFNSQHTGTQLALLLKSSDAKIIKVDVEASTLEAFIDDTRKSLLKEEKASGFGQGGFGGQEGFGQFPRMSEDGKAALVIITGNGLPNEKSSRIGAKGVLVAQVGSKSNGFKSEPVELKKGAKLSIDGIQFNIANTGKPSFGDFPLEVEFKSKDKALRLLKGVKFYDGDKEIESQSGGASTIGFLGNYTYGIGYRLKTVPKGKVTIEFEKWSDLKEEQVPFSLTVGFGGQPTPAKP